MGTFDAVKKEWKIKGKQGTIKATVRKLAQYFDVSLEAPKREPANTGYATCPDNHHFRHDFSGFCGLASIRVFKSRINSNCLPFKSPTTSFGPIARLAATS